MNQNKQTHTPVDKKLAWGIIGTGSIAKAFAKGLRTSTTGRLVAVGSRTVENAKLFSSKFDVPNFYGSYEQLLQDPQVEAVYISTPHPQHAEWAIKAAQAGKHILCEKPLTMNFAEATRVVNAAKENNVFLMEAFMYRCHPQTRRLVEILKQGQIGEIRIIQAAFSFNGGSDPEGRLLNKKLGGGGILDVGCYPVSMARLVAGIANNQDFAEPLTLEAAGHIGIKSGVDEYATALLTFPGDIIAQLVSGVQLEMENVVRIYGTEGEIVIPLPWTPNPKGKGSSKIVIYPYGNKGKNQRWKRWLLRQKWWRRTFGHKTISVKTAMNLYSFEADTVAQHLAKRQAPSPAMSWNDTLGNIRTLDRWREAIGMRYDMDGETKKD